VLDKVWSLTGAGVRHGTEKDRAMKKFLLASAVAAALVAGAPGASNAYWGSPQCWQGFGWLRGKALNFTPSIFYEGPLYSYGPYNVPGYAPMYVTNPHHGQYVPAYPAAYYQYAAGNYGAGYPTVIDGAAVPVPADPNARPAEKMPTPEKIAPPKSGPAPASYTVPAEPTSGGLFRGRFRR
jgi:hypothetical protein